MKKILASISVIAVVASLLTGTTVSFLSDTEKSTGNTFTAGAIDLKIDNESFYNGKLNPGTTWLDPRDLSDGQGPGPNGAYLFLTFHDLKPGDQGEDTISLHVDNNDAWGCMDITLTKNDDMSSTEPELNVDVQDDPGDIWDGELAQNLNTVWWVDDGDNVLEEGETIFFNGTFSNLLQMPDKKLKVVLADSTGNMFENGGPLLGSKTYYIGKAWCFGEMALTPIPGNQGVDPTVATGISCDGTPLNNLTQTDSIMGDVSFTAYQARHDASFECYPQEEEPEEADLELDKSVNKSEASVGENVEMTIKVTNAGTDSATGVTVKDLLPSKLTYVSDDGGGSYNSVTGVWTIGSLAPSASATLKIIAKINKAGLITNIAEVLTSDQPDPDSTPGNGVPSEDDQDSASVNGISADLELDKTVNVDEQTIGDEVLFTVTVTNKGPVVATNIEVTDGAPSGLTYLSHLTTAGVYDPGTDKWTIPAIPVNGVVRLDVTVDTPTLGSFTNFAEVTLADQFDPDSTPGNGSTTEDDDDSATVVVVPPAP